jgi:hypothetical protein
MRREITEIVLQREDNAARFEKFCAETCGKAEGQTFLTTSRSFDQARDAVALGRSKGSHPAIILCTLEKNIKPKLTADVEKLAKTSTPDRVVYCWNQRLSQLSSDDLVAIIRKEFPQSSVAVYGVEELSSLAEKTSPIFETHYRAELDSITRVKDASAVETKGLSLALAAFGSDDAKKLRREVSTAAVLVILTAHANLNLVDIARELTTLLNLPKGLDPEYIRTTTNECVASGLIDEKSGIWSLTVAGLEKAAALSTQAADQLLTGRILIRQRLEASIGRKLDDKQYEIVWSTLQDFFAELFYSNGLATICAVNEILSDTVSGSGDKVNLRKLVADGAARVGESVPTHNQRTNSRERFLTSSPSAPEQRLTGSPAFQSDLWLYAPLVWRQLPRTKSVRY